MFNPAGRASHPALLKCQVEGVAGGIHIRLSCCLWWKIQCRVQKQDHIVHLFLRSRPLVWHGDCWELLVADWLLENPERKTTRKAHMLYSSFLLDKYRYDFATVPNPQSCRPETYWRVAEIEGLTFSEFVCLNQRKPKQFRCLGDRSCKKNCQWSPRTNGGWQIHFVLFFEMPNEKSLE